MELGGGAGVAGLADARSFAAADFDRDGDVDFAVNNYKAPAALYMNRIGQEQGWLSVRLQGSRSNRDAIGAVLVAEVGDLELHRAVGSHAYSGQFENGQLVGLGSAESAALQVIWPGGTREDFGVRPAGSRITLVEGEGIQVVASAAGPVQAGAERYLPAALAVACAGLLLGAGFRRRRGPLHV